MNAPRQNWKLYEEKALPEHVKWLRSLTREESVEMFRSMARLAASFPTPPDEMERIDAYRWQRKLEDRRHQVKAFQALDALRDARAHSRSSG